MNRRFDKPKERLFCEGGGKYEKSKKENKEKEDEERKKAESR
jgi:hypothetical protein